MNFTLHIWRQKNTNSSGQFVTYNVSDIDSDTSFLEMLDQLNEDLIEKGEDCVVFDYDCREGICGTCSLVINLLKKQAGRRTPVYTSEQTSVLFEDMTIMDNIWFYRLIGSVHPRLAKQMLVTFGLYERRHTILKNLNANEKHLTMLIMALAGSTKTCILDEPFTGLSHD